MSTGDEFAELSKAGRAFAIALARAVIRTRVKLTYLGALAVGNGAAADRCKDWLDGDQLYPPEKFGAQAFAHLTKIAAAQRHETDGRYSLVGVGPACGQCHSRGVLLYCRECFETVCLECDCECYREGDELEVQP
jgi:hypothetical protein